MDEIDFEELRDMLACIETQKDELRGRELDFIEDQLERLKKWGASAKFSEKQLKWIRDIYERI